MKVLYVTLSVVIADQVTKLLVRGVQIPFLGINITGMPLYSSKEVMGNFLRFTYIQNPGMAFGIDFGWKSFFAIFSIIASIAIFIYLYKVRQESRVVRFSLALILGGAIGNLIDRVFYGPLFDGTSFFHGRVVDFIDFDFFNIHILGYNFSRFPVFNIADASVTVGVIMLLVFHKRTVEQTEPELAVGEKLENGQSRPLSGSRLGESSSGTCGQTSETTRP
ncbi:MAG: signal peptidase II [Bacteroidetes bacterium]|nr:signal peptidase II [Bacteroidota bacterium]MCL5739201.1 signal peptidase II [Bacteroidota bacterium]